MTKLIKTVEFLKEKIPSIKLLYEVFGEKDIDVYEPTEEGLDTVQIDRFIPTLKVTVMLNSKDKCKDLPGYREMSNEVPQKVFDEFMNDVDHHLKKNNHKRHLHKKQQHNNIHNNQHDRQ